MVRQSWFDEKTNLLLFNQYVSQMESWQKALADGIIEPSEVKQQADQVAEMVRVFEPQLSDEQHEALTQIFYEWAVLQAMVGYLELSEVDEEE